MSSTFNLLTRGFKHPNAARNEHSPQRSFQLAKPRGASSRRPGAPGRSSTQRPSSRAQRVAPRLHLHVPGAPVWLVELLSVALLLVFLVVVLLVLLVLVLLVLLLICC